LRLGIECSTQSRGRGRPPNSQRTKRPAGYWDGDDGSGGGSGGGGPGRGPSSSASAQQQLQLHQHQLAAQHSFHQHHQQQQAKAQQAAAIAMHRFNPQQTRDTAAGLAAVTAAAGTAAADAQTFAVAEAVKGAIRDASRAALAQGAFKKLGLALVGPPRAKLAAVLQWILHVACAAKNEVLHADTAAFAVVR
jgi:hypothetical protein